MATRWLCRWLTPAPSGVLATRLLESANRHLVMTNAMWRYITSSSPFSGVQVFWGALGVLGVGGVHNPFASVLGSCHAFASLLGSCHLFPSFLGSCYPFASSLGSCYPFLWGPVLLRPQWVPDDSPFLCPLGSAPAVTSCPR